MKSYGPAVGHWNHIAQEVVARTGTSLEESARLFALLNIAMADAAICAWDARYTYNFWRPVSAIRFGDTDGNPATMPDPSWSSFIVTPPFPDYVPGHSAFSAAAATALALFYGTDDIPFTTGSDALPGVFRSFPSFSSAAVEAATSRIYGGIHFRFASQDGLSAGSEIGRWTFSNYLRVKGNRSRR
ncbi:MAG TPA: vanadium-dependent haloperoxidase [Vicinamibacterales bacterium]|nr:vanadium-dependent haloperoxidase [Vicinamibacterales bacterium]